MRGDDHRILAADYFHVEDVLVNSIYAMGMRSLARLLGDTPEAAEFNRQADKTRDALLEKCWDPGAGAFFDLSGVDELSVGKGDDQLANAADLGRPAARDRGTHG